MAERDLAELEAVLDDIGRRCPTRETARRLIAEKAAEEERGQALRRRQQEHLTANAAEAHATIPRGSRHPRAWSTSPRRHCWVPVRQRSGSTRRATGSRSTPAEG